MSAGVYGWIFRLNLGRGYDIRAGSEILAARRRANARAAA